MGKGVGFGEFPREIPLSQIERSFYNINEKDQNVMRDLLPEVVLFAAKMMDIIKNELPYELNPNAVLVLADHISFAIERMKKNLRVKMPLAYDIRQNIGLQNILSCGSKRNSRLRCRRRKSPELR